MTRFRMLRLFLTLPKVSRTTIYQFCVSNHLEKNSRQQSIFEKYLQQKMENKNPASHEDEREENDSKLDSSSELVVETEKADKKSSLDHSGTPVKNGETAVDVSNETVSDKDQTKVPNPLNVSKHYRPYTIKPYQDVNLDVNTQNKGENSQSLKSEVIEKPELNSVSNPDERQSETHGLAKPPLKFILNCELIQDVKSALTSEDYLLFNEYLEKIGITKQPAVSAILRRDKKQPVPHSEVPVQISSIISQEARTNFNTTIYKYLCGEKSVQISPDIQDYWDSIEHVLDSFAENDIKILDLPVSHPLLHYTGRIPCIAVYRNSLCFVDWNISFSLSQKSIYCHRAGAYLGAINTSFDPDLKRLGPVTNAVTIVVSPTGFPATVHYLTDYTVHEVWYEWLEKLHNYWSTYRPR